MTTATITQTKDTEAAEGRKGINVRIPVSLWRRAKMAGVNSDTSLHGLLLEGLEIRVAEIERAETTKEQ